MPRRARAADQIIIPEGAPDFRIGAWWMIYKEARLFIPRGYSSAMTRLDLSTLEPLVELEKEAVKSIAEQTEWPKQLQARHHWEDCARNQIKSASDESPMLFSKLLLSIETLQLYAISQNKQFDAYQAVTIIPAAYHPAGWTEDLYTVEKNAKSEGYKNFMLRARQMGQVRPDLLLHDLAKGYHCTYEIAELVCASFPDHDLEVEPARRPGRRGVTPASDHLR